MDNVDTSPIIQQFQDSLSSKSESSNESEHETHSRNSVNSKSTSSYDSKDICLDGVDSNGFDLSEDGSHAEHERWLEKLNSSTFDAEQTIEALSHMEDVEDDGIKVAFYVNLAAYFEPQLWTVPRALSKISKAQVSNHKRPRMLEDSLVRLFSLCIS